MARITIPAKQNIHETDQEDPLKWYYVPGTRYFYLKRLEMAVDLLDNAQMQKLLDIGFGSGIFLPELVKKCKTLYGIDVHEKIDLVRQMLEKEGVAAELSQGSVLDLQFENETFDCVVCVSVLEHIRDLDKAIGEIHRILKKGGIAILGFPVKNKITDSALHVLGFNLDTTLEERHPSSHQMILNAVRKKFEIEDKLKFPKFLPLNCGLYYVCRCAKR